MDMQKTLAVRVVRRRDEAANIISLELRDVDGGELPEFTAGAHIDLHVGPGLIRQYSLCNSTNERDRYVIGVLRDPSSRGGSVAIFDHCVEGALVNISQPRNHFPLRPASRSILLGGGIGVTPLLSMAHALFAGNAEFEMHYCTRNVTQLAFASEIATSGFSDRVMYHFSEGVTAKKINLTEVLARCDVDTRIYVCGSPRFIDWVYQTANDLGWPSEQICCEYFTGKDSNTNENHSIDIQIASTGQVLSVPADRSISAVLQEAGIELYVACEQGTCGTCVTGVLEGIPDHRDVFLTDEQRATGRLITPCCSRAKSKTMTLDL